MSNYSSEHKLQTEEQKKLWQQVEHHQLHINSNVSLAWCRLRHPNSDKAIVISNGRIESYVKYQEMFFDLHQQGYCIYALDHRGQGLSSRLTDDPQIGHIDQFSDYVDDFKIFIDSIVLPAQHKFLYLLAHSMGSTIATLYLQGDQNTFKAAVFSAPMYGIKLPLPKPFIYWLAKQFANKKPNYVISGTPYQSKPFKGNRLTQSAARYRWFRELYQQQPSLQLGAPSDQWLIEALDAAESCEQALQKISTPILILQAQCDKIVDNKAQNKFAENLKEGKLITFISAKHELFVESDHIRNQVMDELLNFYKQHS
ncbi:MAG: alpha/beta fold hydrolase [Parashewanella sp.]